MVDHIIRLSLKGYDSFSSSYEWIAKVTGTLLCPHCHNVFESVDRIDAVVDSERRRTDLDLIAVQCGSVSVVSTRFIGAVGCEELERTAGIGRVYDAKGFEHERYRTAVARDNSAVIRGSDASSVGLCRNCGRLLYWAVGDQYILRQDLPKDSFFLSDGDVFCTAEFYEERVRRAKLVRVGATKVSVRNEPIDGLPESTDELRRYLKTHRMLK